MVTVFKNLKFSEDHNFLGFDLIRKILDVDFVFFLYSKVKLAKTFCVWRLRNGLSSLKCFS